MQHIVMHPNPTLRCIPLEKFSLMMNTCRQLWGIIIHVFSNSMYCCSMDEIVFCRGRNSRMCRNVYKH